MEKFTTCFFLFLKPSLLSMKKDIELTVKVKVMELKLKLEVKSRLRFEVDVEVFANVEFLRGSCGIVVNYDIRVIS